MVFGININVVCIVNNPCFDSKRWACVSVAFTVSRVCACLQGHRSVWAPYCEMWQDAEPSLQKGTQSYREELQIQAAGGGRRCLHRPQDAGAGLLAQDQRRPTAGRCCTSLRAKGKERCVRVFLEHGGKGWLGQWRDVQQWDKESVGNDQPSLMFTINCGWFAQRDS